MNGRGVFRLRDCIGSPDCQAGLPDGRWVRAVPEPFYFGLITRLSAAREVLFGRAVAMQWPKAGDLEKALGRRPGMSDTECLSLATRLREYVDNPHHINPMSGRFRQAILAAAAALVGRDAVLSPTPPADKEG